MGLGGRALCRRSSPTAVALERRPHGTMGTGGRRAGCPPANVCVDRAMRWLVLSLGSGARAADRHHVARSDTGSVAAPAAPPAALVTSGSVRETPGARLRLEASPRCQGAPLHVCARASWVCMGLVHASSPTAHLHFPPPPPAAARCLLLHLRRFAIDGALAARLSPLLLPCPCCRLSCSCC